ncbi:hypothetical protein KNO15_00110 [Leifsonia shinshuensis]|uniref:hypothetical protein n=1 Tax=Leifsonia shinshuensis TaxID=150026 RepID=UPI001F512E2C|nr:hypothetical protein [Leifsonia shinshuensis]MCI0155105.1 hypothetical protein [Leifsonia shinshuensis]
MPSSGRRRLTVSRLVMVWGGRALILVTVAAAVATWLTHASWAAEGWDSNGVPRSWVPNAALVLVLATALSSQWLCGLTAPPSAAWRDGDDLVADTVIGRRRIRLSGALVVPFRALGNGGSVHGAILIGHGLRVLVLLSPVATDNRSAVARLVGRRVPATRGRVGIEYLIGFLWLIVTVVGVFVFLGLACWWMGMFPS